MYYSQAGQDKWVHDIIGDKGFFVDVGAYDGIESSNTFFLEQRGWVGMCIEANLNAYAKLIENRTRSLNVNVAVTDYTGMCAFGTDRIQKLGKGGPVRCDTLNNVLLARMRINTIHYLSMDIEGEELNALQDFDFNKWDIKLITVEHNLYCDGPEKKDALFELLTKNGFTRVRDNVLCPDPNYLNQPFEDWYQKM